MVSFSFCLIVSATLLVQSLHSARNYNFDDPGLGSFHQSKDSNKKVLKLRAPGLTQVRSVLNTILEDVVPLSKDQKRNIKEKRLERKMKSNSNSGKRSPEWNDWTEWSSCSVTCGKGRQIRWRHCLQHCEGVETEMEEKSCQLPACEGKLFGLIKL